MANTGGRNPARIAEEIEATRAELDETLDALQRKLSPGQLIDQLMVHTRNGPGELITNFGHAAKRNPVALALTGVGIAWLMWGGSRAERPALYAPAPHGDPLAEGFMAPQPREGAEAGGGTVARVGERAKHLWQRTGDALGGAQERTARVGSQVQDLVRREPIVLAAVGIAIGAALGGATGTAGESEEEPERVAS